MTVHPLIDVEKFWKEGYLLIRNVFQPGEIEEFRRRVFEANPWPGDLLSHPRLRGILLDDRVLSVAAQILGDTPVYYGDSSVNVGRSSPGFHKDNPDRYNDGPDWKGRYTQIRFGLYLEDHAWHSGGLRIMPRSHNGLYSAKGKAVSVRSRVGDLVVWNLRTDHSAMATLLRFFPWLYVEPRITGNWEPRYLIPLARPFPLKIPRFLFADEGPERAALFFTLGLDDAHRERNTAYLKSRTYAVENWKRSEYGPDTWEAVQGKDIRVIDLGEEVRQQLTAGDTALGAHQGHMPIPY